MRRLFAIGALASGLLVVGSGEAYAQYHTYMYVPGIPGSAYEENHKDWIEVLSMSQGVIGTKKSVACSDLSIMKYLDQAGPLLWAAAAMGQVFPEVRIELITPGLSGGVLYDIRIRNARVTSSQTSGSSELPAESVSFTYQSIILTYNIPDDKGNLSPGVPQTITCQ